VLLLFHSTADATFNRTVTWHIELLIKLKLASPDSLNQALCYQGRMHKKLHLLHYTKISVRQ